MVAASNLVVEERRGKLALKTVSTKLEDDEAAKLDALAKQAGTTRQDVIADIIRGYLNGGDDPPAAIAPADNGMAKAAMIEARFASLALMAMMRPEECEAVLRRVNFMQEIGNDPRATWDHTATDPEWEKHHAEMVGKRLARDRRDRLQGRSVARRFLDLFTRQDRRSSI